MSKKTYQHDSEEYADHKGLHVSVIRTEIIGFKTDLAPIVYLPATRVGMHLLLPGDCVLLLSSVMYVVITMQAVALIHAIPI